MVTICHTTVPIEMWKTHGLESARLVEVPLVGIGTDSMSFETR